MICEHLQGCVGRHVVGCDFSRERSQVGRRCADRGHGYFSLETETPAAGETSRAATAGERFCPSGGAFPLACCAAFGYRMRAAKHSAHMPVVSPSSILIKWTSPLREIACLQSGQTNLAHRSRSFSSARLIS